MYRIIKTTTQFKPNSLLKYINYVYINCTPCPFPKHNQKQKRFTRTILLKRQLSASKCFTPVLNPFSYHFPLFPISCLLVFCTCFAAFCFYVMAFCTCFEAFHYHFLAVSYHLPVIFILSSKAI